MTNVKKKYRNIFDQCFDIGYTTSGIPAATYNPDIANTGSRSSTGGFYKKINGARWNASVADYFGLKQTLTAANNPNLRGVHTNHGLTIGLGFRRWSLDGA